MGEVAQVLSERGFAHIPSAYIRPPEERPEVAHDSFTHQHTIPLIDLSQARPRAELVQEIGQACECWGFFQVHNHGVPSRLLEQMMEVGTHFFALPSHDKQLYACKPGVIASEGYGHRMLVRDDQVLDWRDYFDHHTLPLSRRNPNNWPHNPPAYRQTIIEYSEHMKLLAQRLLALISESLGLKASYIQDAIGEPFQNVSLNYYPPCPQPELTLGLQSHSDLGAITLLFQDEVGGLQVCIDGNWLAVQPIHGALVVNLADQIQILSNGRYKSIEHRAVVNKNKSRISVATFYDPSKDAVILPASELVDFDHPALYNNVLFGDHVSSWYQKGPKGKKVLNSLSASLDE